MVEQNGGKLRRLEKIIKKIAFDRNQNFFSGNVIALCVDSDEKIKKKICLGQFKSKKRARKITSRGVSGVKFDSLPTS